MKTAYKIALPDDVHFMKGNSDAVLPATIAAFVKSLHRPEWYANPGNPKLDVRDYMLQNPKSFGSQTAVIKDPFTNRDMRMWQCAMCKNGTTYDGVHLGHVRKWRDELVVAGVTTADEARAAYNNLLNLQIECSSCNASHDWE